MQATRVLAVGASDTSDNVKAKTQHRAPNPTDRQNTWKLPAYHLFDLGVNHGFTIGNFDATLRGNMNNIFNVEYVSDAFDASSHSAADADVFYGAGRTFSLGLTVNF